MTVPISISADQLKIITASDGVTVLTDTTPVTIDGTSNLLGEFVKRGAVALDLNGQYSRTHEYPLAMLSVQHNPNI